MAGTRNHSEGADTTPMSDNIHQTITNTAITMTALTSLSRVLPYLSTINMSVFTHLEVQGSGCLIVPEHVDLHRVDAVEICSPDDLLLAREAGVRLDANVCSRQPYPTCSQSAFPQVTARRKHTLELRGSPIQRVAIGRAQ